MIVVSHDLDEAVYLADEVLMLTRRPTKIAEVVEFKAARPRSPAHSQHKTSLMQSPIALMSFSVKCEQRSC